MAYKCSFECCMVEARNQNCRFPYFWFRTEEFHTVPKEAHLRINPDIIHVFALFCPKGFAVHLWFYYSGSAIAATPRTASISIAHLHPIPYWALGSTSPIIRSPSVSPVWYLLNWSDLFSFSQDWPSDSWNARLIPPGVLVPHPVLCTRGFSCHLELWFQYGDFDLLFWDLEVVLWHLSVMNWARCSRSCRIADLVIGEEHSVHFRTSATSFVFELCH